MKAEKKTGRKIGIKWSIFGYLLIFIFILLAILWVMQTVYLESFYKNIKERELKSAVSQVVEVMNGSQYKDEIEVLAKKNVSYWETVMVTGFIRQAVLPQKISAVWIVNR